MMRSEVSSPESVPSEGVPCDGGPAPVASTAVPSDIDALRRLHPATLLFRVIGVARSMALPTAPVVIVILTGPAVAVPYSLAVIGLTIAPLVIGNVARFLAFRFRLGADELVLHSGVLSRQQRVIPMARVQSIDVRQSALQRLFGMAEVHIETAGGEPADSVFAVIRGLGAEASLSVLPLRDAEAIAEALNRGRRRAMERATAGGDGARNDAAAAAEVAAATVECTGHAAGSGADDAPRPVARVSPPELALAGGTANEIGLVAALILAGTQFLDGLPLPVAGPGERLARFVADRLQLMEPDAAVTDAVAQQALADVALEVGTMLVVAAVILLVVVLVIAGWVVSIASTVVRYHDFRLERTAGELRKRYGLLSRRSVTIPLRRIQVLRVEESLLRRPIERAALRVSTAGAAPGQAGGTQLLAPIARRADVPRLVAAVHDDVDYDALRFHPVHPRARRRIFLRYALVIGALAGAAVWAYGGAGALVLALLPLAFGLADRQYRNRGYALAPGYVAARAGFFNHVTWLIPDGRIQALHLTESPFQRRYGLATLVIDTAGGWGGTARVVDLSRKDALRLMETLERRMDELRRAGAREGRATRPESVRNELTPRR